MSQILWAYLIPENSLAAVDRFETTSQANCIVDPPGGISDLHNGVRFVRYDGLYIAHLIALEEPRYRPRRIL